MRRGVTLVELIITLVIASILSIGMFTAIKTVAIQSQKAKARSIHSLDTQTALDQIAALFYHRVPQSAIGYNASTGYYDGLSEISDGTTTLEWLGTFNEVVLDENVSGFVDMNRSIKPNLYSPDTNTTNLMTRLDDKWESSNVNDMALVFAGSLDQGVLGGGFGWHGGSDSNDTLKFTLNANPEIFVIGNPLPDRIYEKYYLVDTAYAVTRGEHVADISNCPNYSDLQVRDLNNTLFLFYNFRPWRRETFCGDVVPPGYTAEGDVTILAEDIIYFRVETSGASVRISIEAKENINGSETPVRISKQKVVF